MIVGIITARKNSKGIPGKNLINLGGIPLIQHTFIQAIESNSFDKIILSTDSVEIINLSKKFKQIEAPFIRPDNISLDTSLQIEVIEHTLDFLETKKYPIKHFVLLQPTVPFRKIDEIRKGVELLKNGANSVIGVSEVMHHPADYLEVDEKGKINYLLPKYASKPRQAFPKVYFNNGGFYGCNINYFKTFKKFYDENSILLKMNEECLIDIDTEFDLKLANGLIKI